MAGGQALIHYERLAYPSGSLAAGRIAEGLATMSYTVTEGDLTGYTGITLNFGSVMPDFVGSTWTVDQFVPRNGFWLKV